MAEFVRIVTVLLLLLVSAAGLAGLMVLCDTLFPTLVARSRNTLEQMPLRSLATGFVNTLFFGLVAAAFGRWGNLAGLLALLVIVVVLGLLAIGLAGLARLVGERLPLGEASPLRRLLLGVLVLELAAITPIVGWLAVCGLAGLAGLGATILALARREPGQS